MICPWNSLGKNTGVGCHSLLQGIFPTQGSNLGLLHCRWILYCLNHQETPITSKEAPMNGKRKLSWKMAQLFALQMGRLQSTYYPSLPGAHSGRGLDISLLATFPLATFPAPHLLVLHRVTPNTCPQILTSESASVGTQPKMMGNQAEGLHRVVSTETPALQLLLQIQWSPEVPVFLLRVDQERR